jgi:hypothetical protein
MRTGHRGLARHEGLQVAPAAEPSFGHEEKTPMADFAIWEVSLYLDGPVTVRRRVLTTQQKGFRVDDPF